MIKRRLTESQIHLGLGASAIAQPAWDGMDWYRRYGERVKDDGDEARLVAEYRFTENWAGWEMHPAGDEVVICIEGEIVLIQQVNGEEVRTALTPGEYAINPRGVWHTADIEGEAAAIFITAGIGTQHRPR